MCDVLKKPEALLVFRRRERDYLCFFYCFHSIANLPDEIFDKVFSLSSSPLRKVKWYRNLD